MRAGFLGEHVLRRTRADGEHVRTENTCRRDTSDASGQQWANAGREVATPFSFLFFIYLGIVCV